MAKKIRLGVGLWCVSFASDRFVSGGYRPMRSLEEQIKMVARIKGAESFDLHTSDFTGISAKEVGKMASDNGLVINAVNPNIFGDPVFKYGAFSNTDEKIRRKAIDLVKESFDIARELKANVSSLWPGQDGFDYYFQCNYDKLWDNTIASMREIVDYAPDLKICYEFKPKEPRMFSLAGSAAKALLIVNEVSRKNFGCVLDYGHALFANENPSESLRLFDRAGKLFNIHFNDAYGTWDDDLMAGTVNIWSNIEFFWYLKQSSYDGYVTLDMFPFREEPYEACSLALRMIRDFERIADALDAQTIRQFQHANDAAGVMEYLRKEVLAR
jgi:L-rhamnose isomerase